MRRPQWKPGACQQWAAGCAAAPAMAPRGGKPPGPRPAPGPRALPGRFKLLAGTQWQVRSHSCQRAVPLAGRGPLTVTVTRTSVSRNLATVTGTYA